MSMRWRFRSEMSALAFVLALVATPLTAGAARAPGPMTSDGASVTVSRMDTWIHPIGQPIANMDALAGTYPTWDAVPPDRSLSEGGGAVFVTDGRGPIGSTTPPDPDDTTAPYRSLSWRGP